MLSKAVTDISDTHYELIAAILSFDWFSRLPAEVAAYTEFLVHLTFARPNFFDKIYTSMVTCFRGPPQTSSGTFCLELPLFGSVSKEKPFFVMYTNLIS